MSINQLPVELLQRIFTFYVRVQVQEDSDYHGRRVPRGYIRRSIRLVEPEDEEMEFVGGMTGEAEEESRILQHQSIPEPNHSRSSTPIHLSVVCHYWRFITLAMPGLWARVDVRAPVEPRDVPIYEAWFARSGEELLNLSICDSNVGTIDGDGRSPRSSSPSSSSSNPGPESKEALFAIVQRAMSVCHRWRKIRLAIQEEDAGRMVFAHSSYFSSSEGGQSSAGTSLITPNLESFDITLRETGAVAGSGGNGVGGAGPGSGQPIPLPPSLSSPIIHILCRTLSLSPNLSSASWGAYVDKDSILSYIPFHKLRYLGLEFIEDKDAREVLGACRESLREVRIGRYGAQPSDDGAVHSPQGIFFGGTPFHFQQSHQHGLMPITLQKLEVATLFFVDEFDTPPSFFTSFLTPSLEKLNLPYGFGAGLPPDDGWKALVRFLERSGCTLRTLRFGDAVRMRGCEEYVMSRYLESRVFSGLRECTSR